MDDRTTGVYSTQYVNLEEGLISRDIFTSQSIYERELERVFVPSWLFVGHDSHIPEPRDFILGRIGEESYILNSARSGEIHFLLKKHLLRNFLQLFWQTQDSRNLILIFLLRHKLGKE